MSDHLSCKGNVSQVKCRRMRALIRLLSTCQAAHSHRKRSRKNPLELHSLGYDESASPARCLFVSSAMARRRCCFRIIAAILSLDEETSEASELDAGNIFLYTRQLMQMGFRSTPTHWFHQASKSLTYFSCLSAANSFAFVFIRAYASGSVAARLSSSLSSSSLSSSLSSAALSNGDR